LDPLCGRVAELIALKVAVEKFGRERVKNREDEKKSDRL
jgi:hypothetical protein